MYRVELYGRIRRACHVEGMSIREAARLFGLHRDTVRKMLRYSVPPGYQRRGLPRRPKLDPFKGVIDQILQDDRGFRRSSDTQPSGYTSVCEMSTRSLASTRS